MSRPEGIEFGRREFVALALPAIAALVPIGALAHGGDVSPRSLKLHNLHTGERLETVYYAGGHYLDGPLGEIDWILRDWRTDEQAPMDRRLLNLLHALHEASESTEAFEIISGYRSPRTNRMLADRNRGVARKSLHVKAMAADVRLPGRDLRALYRAARSLELGGVGFYPKAGFIHVDCGRPRAW